MYSFDEIANFDPEIAQAMTDEINRQDHNIELIASENIVSGPAMMAMGTVYPRQLWQLWEVRLRTSTQRDIRESVTTADVSMSM